MQKKNNFNKIGKKTAAASEMRVFEVAAVCGIKEYQKQTKKMVDHATHVSYNGVAYK